MLYTAGAMMGKDFLKHVSQKIVFVTDLLQITVGTINFTLMLSMSQQFRDTLLQCLGIHSDEQTSKAAVQKDPLIAGSGEHRGNSDK
jgi:hypothetical protein